MALTKDDRIAFSKKIVEAPFMIVAVNNSKNAIQIEKDKAQKTIREAEKASKKT